MRALRLLLWGVFGLLCVQAVVLAGADEPVFVQWLVVDDPGDETIRDYWQRAELGELDAPGLVDLGTMLFYRGYPKDAVRMFKEALDIDKDLYEAWFRIGLVKHSQGELGDARRAYKRCLKKLTGHGWCNFYLGLLEEQEGDTTDALYHFRRAFKFAPELSDPKVNPEMLNSDLALAAKLREYHRVNFKNTVPMPYLQAAEVRKVRRQYEPAHEPQGTAEVEGGMAAEPTEMPREERRSPVDIRTPVPAPSETESPPSPPARPAPVRQPPSRSSESSGTTGVSATAGSGGTASSSGAPGGSGAASPPPSRAGGTPPRVTPIPNASPEARLELRWPGPWKVVSALI